MKKRLLALFMVLVLLLTCLPTGVLAEGTEVTEPETTPIPQTEAQTEETTEAAVIPEPHSHSAAHDCLHCDETVEWIAWGDDTEELTSIPTATGHYYLVADVSVNAQTRVQGTADVVVCLNGWNIDGSNACNIYRVQDTASLTVSDCTSYTDDAGNLVAGSVRNGKNKDVSGGFYVSTNANLLLHSIKLTGHENTQAASNAGWSGGAIHARNSAVVTLINVELSNNKTSADGGAICLRNSAQLILENCVFKDNEAATSGGAIYMATKTTKLTATGCSFEGNDALAGNGGAVCTIAEATDITLTNCDFRGNTSGNRGGAVYVDACSVTITGGEMTNNRSKTGGAVQCYKGNTTMTGVTVTGNQVSGDGGNAIYVSGGSGKLKLDSCTITGNYSTGTKTTYRGGVYLTNNSDKLTVCGATVIDDNMLGVVDGGSGTKEVNVLLQNAGATMNVDGLTAGAKFSVLTYAGAVETPSFLVDVKDPVSWDKTWVTYENNGLAVDYDKQKDEFFFTSTSTHIHCACGEHLYTDESCEHAPNPGCDHSQITYEPWESTNSLPKDPGNYYLTADVVVTKETPVSTNGGIPDIINLCLNGHTITVAHENEGKINDQIFYMSVTAELTISDCTAHVDENGNYVAGKLTGGTYSVITAGVTGTTTVYKPAITLNLFDGILSGNTSNGNGGAICMSEGTSTFNMYGGLITDNTAKGSGGAVYVGKGNSFHMYGGEITGNTAGVGGGVYIHADAAAVSVEGNSVITENKAGAMAGNLYLAGEVTATIGTMGEKANVGISGDLGTLPRKVSTNEAALTGLTGDSQYRPLELIDGYVYISFTKDHAHCVCGGGDLGCEHTENYWVAWDNAAGLPTGDGYYYLVTDVTLVSTAVHNAGNLHLCLNGHTVTANGEEGTKSDRVYNVSGDATLSISDCTAVYAKDGTYTAGKITGGTQAVIFVPNQTGTNADGTQKTNACVINLYDGILTGNTSNVGGALIVQDGAVFNMYGGEISGNTSHVVTAADGTTSDGNGAAMYVGNDAIFNLYDGAICDNAAENSAAVYIYNAIFNMHGGAVSRNSAQQACAGALLTGASTVMTMTGGEIDHNTTGEAAGGILLQSKATFNMEGGKIYENTASHGGGVYVSYTTTMHMSGGQIVDNTAKTSGGGLYVLGAAVKLSGGKISDNYAKGNGGGIYATHFVRAATETREEQRYTSEIDLAGASVSGNSAGGNGAGICVSNATVVNMSAGSISGNHTSKAAGGILLQSRSVFNLRGGSISNNSAQNGGGVYVSTNTTIKMTGGTVSYNTSKGSCAGMYLLRCNATLAGGTIANNHSMLNGGGLYVAGAKLRLAGTNIRDNVADSNGGGICTTHAKDGAARYYTTITMTGGTISGNTALNGGGILLQNKSVMTFQDGVVENNKTSKAGGGIYVSSTCEFTMEGGTVQNNEAAGNGGGIYHYRSNGTYTGGLIQNNVALGNAGGILATGEGYTVTIRDLTVTGNSAKGGGGIVFQGRVVGNIEGGQFTNNTASANAGALYVSSNTTANVTGGTFSGNTAENRGGAVYLAVTSNTSMANATFTENKATDGGAIYAQSNLTISDCVIRNNSAANNGGGLSTGKLGAKLFFQPKGLVATNLTVENNTAGTQGGGLYLSVGAQADIRNSTITGNTSGAEGGGIWAIFDTNLYDLNVTGNTSGGEGYALYLAASEYDGESYVKGVIKIAGVMQVDGNQGGDLYIGEQTTVSVAKEGLADGTKINVKLHSGYLTQTLYGEYDYEGGNLAYVVTAGDRSVTDPEYDAAWNDQFKPAEDPGEEPTQAPTDGNDGQQSGKTNPVVWIAAGAGAVVIAAVIAIIAVLSKKKKTAAGK